MLSLSKHWAGFFSSLLGAGWLTTACGRPLRCAHRWASVQSQHSALATESSG